jgi:hypothetical protein
MTNRPPASIHPDEFGFRVNPRLPSYATSSCTERLTKRLSARLVPT